jgi:hypothetical protein
MQIKTVFEGAAKVFLERGAGVALYFVLDQEDIRSVEAAVNIPGKRQIFLQQNRNAELADKFSHFIYADDLSLGALADSGYETYDTFAGNNMGKNGSFGFTSRGTREATAINLTKLDEFHMIALAHEVMHLLINPGVKGVWIAGEHLNRNQPVSELMRRSTDKSRFELATVTIGEPTQVEIDVAGNPSLK